jgi:hypothetical protein
VEMYLGCLRYCAIISENILRINKMNRKPIAVGLVFGVGMALALDNWLLGIMFGIIFYVALNEKEKREVSSSEEE